MRRFKVMVLAPAAAMAMLVGLAGPAGAGGKVGIDPGRGASTGGLVTATIKQTVVQDKIGSERPLEQVSLNLVMAQDPDQPGVTPGGGGVEP